MTRGIPDFGRLLLFAFVCLSVARPDGARAAEAPFGDKIGAAVVNYNRASPVVATSGLLKDGAVARLRTLGFKAVIDLRGPEEGIARERAAVGAAGLTYINIPVTTRAPAPDQVGPFAAAVEDPANWPVLVHCVSANRAGAMWALYRAARGVPPEVAVEEGRAQGMKRSREAAVRRQLGLAPLKQ